MSNIFFIRCLYLFHDTKYRKGITSAGKRVEEVLFTDKIDVPVVAAVPET